MRKAFTMIELVFVIVVLGILAAVAVPKMGATTELAVISKGKADIATIRSAIVNERQTRIVRGDPNWISELTSNGNTTTLFDGNGTSTLLMYGIKSGTTSGKWSRGVGANINQYTYKVGVSSNIFRYTNSDGKFLCTSGNECSELTN